LIVVNLSTETAAIVEGSLLKLSGSIGMDSVAGLYRQGLTSLEDPIEKVDCRAITSGDSACLALLLFLQSKIDTPLILIGLPPSLKVLVDLYCLSELFSFSEDTALSASH